MDDEEKLPQVVDEKEQQDQQLRQNAGLDVLYREMQKEMTYADPKRKKKIERVLEKIDRVAPSLSRISEHVMEQESPIPLEALSSFLDERYRSQPRRFSDELMTILSWQEHILGSRFFTLADDPKAFKHYSKRKKDDDMLVLVDRKTSDTNALMVQPDQQGSKTENVHGVSGKGFILSNDLRVLRTMYQLFREKGTYGGIVTDRIIFMPPEEQKKALPSDI